MFQEVKYGPWPEVPRSVAGRPTRLVSGVKPLVALRHASIRRSDTTLKFRESFLSEIGPLDADLSDGLHLFDTSYDDFKRSYWARECFSKLDLADKAEIQMLEQRAIEKLIAKEASSREVNERLRRFRLTGKGLTPQTAAAVGKARKLVKSCLGRFSWDEVVSLCRWGPGATTEFGRSSVSPQRNWDAVTHVTARCMPLVEAFSLFSRWEFNAPEVVVSNRITTVPKKTTARRTIAIEPTWNMFFQLGLEGCIRRRLRRIGLLVDRKGFTAQDRHKRLALLGSDTPGLFPTLDFQDASNSISQGLVGLLLPEEWLVALRALRCDSAVLPDGTIHHLEMFSTMGNGYTFVLMTLLIWAISTAVVGETTSVFGDDLILPDSQRFDSIVDVFAELGFTLNKDKSYSIGPFRESCGGHFFRGRDVTPPYFKRRLDTVPEYIKYANALVRVEMQHLDVWRQLINEVPRKYRGPVGYGDSVAVCPWDMSHPRWNRAFQCWEGSTIVGLLPTRDPPERGRLRHGIYPVVSGEGLEVAERRSVRYMEGTWQSFRWF